MAVVNNSCDMEDVKEGVKNFYKRKLHAGAKNIQNVAVSSQYCAARKVPDNIKMILNLCHEEIVSKYYGCGLVFPECIEGRHVLDLGCGTGRDVYILSKMVGEDGHVTGVDLLQGPLDIAKEYIGYHVKQFGYSKPNTDFRLGDIEDLHQAGIEDNMFDAIVSNCVVNLTTNKEVVLKEAYRVLKPGGEMYFSDMYADRVVPGHLKSNDQLWGEGLAGALYWKSLVDICRDVGFSGPYLVNADNLKIEKQEFRDLVGDTQYVSATYRLFKVAKQDDQQCHNVTYKGSIEGLEESFKFDVHTTFKRDVALPVCSTLAEVLHQSRFAKHFTIDPTPLKGNVTSTDVYSLADPVSMATKIPSCKATCKSRT